MNRKRLVSLCHGALRMTCRIMHHGVSGAATESCCCVLSKLIRQNACCQLHVEPNGSLASTATASLIWSLRCVAGRMPLPLASCRQGEVSRAAACMPVQQLLCPPATDRGARNLAAALEQPVCPLWCLRGITCSKCVFTPAAARQKLAGCLVRQALLTGS